MKKHITLLFVAFSFLTSPLVAQEEVKEKVAEEVKAADTKVEEQAKAVSDASAEKAEEAVSEGGGNEDEDERESADGSYEWQASYGIGAEFGIWFTDFERWEICSNDNNTTFQEDCYLTKPNTTLKTDYSEVFNIDLYLEASLLEGTRFSVFGGIQSPFGSEPSVRALYIGIEPAFAFRRDDWELALGVGVALGTANLEHETGEKLDTTLTLLRPFIELRHYLASWSAIYGRVGFNQWLISEDPEVENITLEVSENNLNIGGLWMSVGLRFGSFPSHTKTIGDSDGDGIKDDIDDCPDEAEDMDGFKDDDGCPEADNDEDGILDAVDKCPNVAEDLDGYMDEDGCPETDDDSDGDGILNNVDKCPKVAEDKDGFEDEDGCPELDNDGDSILDTDDKCPLVAEDKDGFQDEDGCPDEDNDGDGFLDAKDKCPNEAEVINGVEDEDGCPDKGKTKVRITETKIEILEKVFFDSGKAKIKSRSFGLLNQVAAVLKAYPKMTKIRVEGHTDDRGNDAFNLKLSQKRAESVVTYLSEQGVAVGRLVATGFGETKPIEDNKTYAGRGANRRVEFNIIEVDGKSTDGKSAVIRTEEKVEEKEPAKKVEDAAKDVKDAAKKVEEKVEEKKTEEKPK